MKFDLVLLANSGDSDPGQNPIQKEERDPCNTISRFCLKMTKIGNFARAVE